MTGSKRDDGLVGGRARSLRSLTAHGKGGAASVSAAALWVILAWRSPTSTHHFAPLVIAGVWGFLARHDEAMPRPSRADRLLMLGGGLAVAATAQVVLTAADKLDGPRLLSAVPVPLELIGMAVVGAVVGSRIWQLFRRPDDGSAGSDGPGPHPGPG
ncbi:MAG: hypothetical protein ACR2QK_17660 [Acidimicrobiales bacterium]